MAWLYRIGAGAYHLGIRMAAGLGNERAQQWTAGRNQDLSVPIGALHAAGRPILWLHAASLGEFEQGRPVLELFREAHPDWAVVLTFFSPSGYQRCHTTELAEVVGYLPQDGAEQAADWMRLLRPRAAIFVKYEFWYFHLHALRRAGVPTLLIAGVFRDTQPFYRWYGEAWREMLDCFVHFGLQTEGDRRLLRQLGHHNATVTGDPRVDRTAGLAAAPFTEERLEAFRDGRPLLFAGSVWPADVEIIEGAWPMLRDRWQLVIAPHQMEEVQLRQWQIAFDAERYTEAPRGGSVLLLDTIGILSRAYRYGSVAFIGGGYGGSGGLHNTLEPMSYGLPVLFGPRHHKFTEAGEAVRRGGAFVIGSSHELALKLSELEQASYYHAASSAQRSYLTEHAGAARRTLALISRWLLLLLVVVSMPLEAQSWQPADRLTAALDGVFGKCNVMVAVAGVDWNPGLCLAAAELTAGQTVSLELQLRGGHKYVFIAGGERTTRDLDLYLRTPGGSLTASDSEDDRTPIVEYTADTTGSYTLQLRLASNQERPAMAAVGVLRSSGRLLSDRDYREASRQLGAAAGAVRAAGGARRFRPGRQGWCVLGHHLGSREGATLEGLSFPPGPYFVIAAGSEDFTDIDLYLADNGLRIIERDGGTDAYPMIEFRTNRVQTYALRVEAARSRRAGLVLVGLLE